MTDRSAPIASVLPPDTPFNVEFSIPDYGWIKLRIPSMIGENQIDCSETDDPFDDFFLWLEAIAGGADTASWQIGEEGCTSHFCFFGKHWIGDDIEQLVLSRTNNRGVYSLTAQPVDRRDLVKQFYVAMRKMVKQPDYDPFHWEVAPPELLGDTDPADISDELREKFPFSGVRLSVTISEAVEHYLATSPGDVT